MASAAARHILVATEKKCADIKKKLDKGVAFAILAKADVPDRSLPTRELSTPPDSAGTFEVRHRWSEPEFHALAAAEQTKAHPKLCSPRPLK